MGQPSIDAETSKPHEPEIDKSARAIGCEPTMAELDALIAKQMANLPAWWRKYDPAPEPTRRESKYLGVYWHAQNGRWHSAITVNRKRIHLGGFDSELEAARAYAEAARRLRPNGSRSRNVKGRAYRKDVLS